MKRTTIYFFAIFISTLSFAQNFVPNWSFEEYTICPNNYNQVENATGWQKASANALPAYSTEFLNACNGGNFGEPYNTWGFQNASTGSGYMALCTMAPYLMTNYRENIYTELVGSLQINEVYVLSMKVSFTDNSQHASNNIGIKLSTSSSFPVNDICHLYSPTVITDKTNWTILTIQFVADSAYKYIAVGNFFTDANTTSIDACPSCGYNQWGYYIDDICLIVKGNGDCSLMMSRENAENNESNIFPNPFNKSTTITLKCPITRGDLIIYNSLGQLIKNIPFSGNEIHIDRDSMKEGIYYYKIVSNSNSINQGNFIVSE